METPLELAFHNLDSTPGLETLIRDHVDKLDRLFDHLTGCRVSVEALHHQHRSGNLYEVHIEMRVPGRELVVSHEPHRAKERFADPDVHVSVRTAFKAAEAQLKTYKRQLHGEMKPQDTMVQGLVSRIFPEQDCGFIMTGDGRQLYFHRNGMNDGAFASLKPGDAVHFVETLGETGPTASKVWLAAHEVPEQE